MHIERIRKYIGLSGVAKNESANVRLVGRYFRVLMVLVAIWLPLQLYLERRHSLSLTIIHISNWVVWLAFFTESIVLVSLVKNKRQFLASNWLNIIIIFGAFPYIWQLTPFVAILRWVQILLVLRLVVPVWDASLAILSRNHLGATLLVGLIITVLWGIVMSAIDPAVQTPWDGIWLAWETVSTVGFGDIIPVTGIGRVLVGLLMLMGLALLSLLTANFSAYFINKGIYSKRPGSEIVKRLDEIQHQLQQIQFRLTQIEDQKDEEK